MCASITASAPKSLRSPWTSEEEASPAATKQEEVWPALGDRSLVPMVEQLFSHLLKVVNICAHVLDDVAPGPAVKVTAGSGGGFVAEPLGSQDCCVHYPSLPPSPLYSMNRRALVMTLSFASKCAYPVRSPLPSSDADPRRERAGGVLRLPLSPDSSGSGCCSRTPSAALVDACLLCRSGKPSGEAVVQWLQADHALGASPDWSLSCSRLLSQVPSVLSERTSRPFLSCPVVSLTTNCLQGPGCPHPSGCLPAP